MSRALISVYNKEGLDIFARFLISKGIDLVSSGGTSAYLKEAGLKVQAVEQVTGFPEVLDGRVKTLHPSVHAGILARRNLSGDMQTLEDHSIAPIDWVVVNLYPFREKAAELVDEAELLEFIDIGGPTMIRAAAKNFYDVAVVSDPRDYQWIMDECTQKGSLSMHSRRYLAGKVFRMMSEYDGAIADMLQETNVEKS